MHDRRVVVAMWRQARVQLDWLAEDTTGRAYAHDPLWGLAALPARWRPQWAQHSFQTGDSDDDPMFGSPTSLLVGCWSGPWSRRAPMRRAPTAAGSTTWLAWGLGPGWCTSPVAVVKTIRRRCGRRIERDRALAMVWPPPAAELGGLPWQWCRDCWAGDFISRGDVETELIPELE